MTHSPYQLPASSAMPEAILCFSHLRWDFVYQRPQHILSRAAAHADVYFIEEPVFNEWPARYAFKQPLPGVTVVTPHLPSGISPSEAVRQQKILLDELVTTLDSAPPVLWYYTPMALAFSGHLESAVTVFDCMDELSAFKFAPPELVSYERELMERADVVFAGGRSLYQVRKGRHDNIHLFPSSIDHAHFAQARTSIAEPDDQASLPKPRLGFFGVIDERFDAPLIAAMADARPTWQFVLVGPIVKIDPAGLPQRANIHYLGGKTYEQLPAYIAGWDIALIPFAINESTRFISPTKTPEYLAAGKPVISSAICDVVQPYGDRGLVRIAENTEAWIAAADALLSKADDKSWLREADAFLAGNSWDSTVAAMMDLIAEAAFVSTETRSVNAENVAA